MTAAAWPGRAPSSLLRYVRRHLRLSLALLAIVTGGAFCAVAAQYGLKLLVDGMTAPETDRCGVMLDLGLFLELLGWNACAGGWARTSASTCSRRSASGHGNSSTSRRAGRPPGFRPQALARSTLFFRTVQSPMMLWTLAASASMANGLVITSMPASSSPLPIAAAAA